MTTRMRQTGEFCWFNILTPKPAEARTFFGQLLDWTYTEIPGMGHTVQVGGRDVGGLFDLEAPGTPPGYPPTIGVMLKVDNADDVCAKVKALGGQAMTPFDIMDRGRMAVCHDPNGAEFDLWEPKSHPGTDVDDMLHGAPCWFETLTTDVDRARTFYSELFGWTSEIMPMPGGGDGDYTVFKRGDLYVAGLMAIQPEMGAKPHWATNFTVQDADVTAQKAEELGGKVFIPVNDVPGIGRSCGVTSPQGVTFYPFQRLC